jgi:hypothetical protein
MTVITILNVVCVRGYFPVYPLDLSSSLEVLSLVLWAIVMWLFFEPDLHHMANWEKYSAGFSEIKFQQTIYFKHHGGANVSRCNKTTYRLINTGNISNNTSKKVSTYKRVARLVSLNH